MVEYAYMAFSIVSSMSWNVTASYIGIGILALFNQNYIPSFNRPMVKGIVLLSQFSFPLGFNCSLRIFGNTYFLLGMSDQYRFTGMTKSYIFDCNVLL
jgi:hypothetical protein